MFLGRILWKLITVKTFGSQFAKQRYQNSPDVIFVFIPNHFHEGIVYIL